MSKTIASASGSFKVTNYGGEPQVKSSFSYSEVQQGLAQGRNPINLWRKFKKVSSLEMAAALEMDYSEYNAMENTEKVSLKSLRGICWYLDIHPSDMLCADSFKVGRYLVKGLINAHNHPHIWPNDTEETRSETQSKLEHLSSTTMAYNYFKAQLKFLNLSNKQNSETLWDIIETMLINDGNKNFHEGGVYGYITEKIDDLESDIKGRRKTVLYHNSKFFEKNEKLNSKGRYIYREQWPYMKEIILACFSPKDTQQTMTFLMNEVPKPKKRLSNICKSDFVELVGLLTENYEAAIFECTKKSYEEETDNLVEKKKIVTDFLNKDFDLIGAFCNRQQIIVQTKGIVTALGEVDSPKYMNARNSVKKHKNAGLTLRTNKLK